MWWEHGRPWTWGILTASSGKGSRQGDRGSQAAGNCRLMILSSSKWHVFGTAGNVICTVTCQRYASFLEQSVTSGIQARRCGTTTVFMQNGAPPHIACCVKQLHRSHFSDDRIISRNFPTVWPPKSPTWILATFGCEDIARPWSALIPLHLYPILNKT